MSKRRSKPDLQPQSSFLDGVRQFVRFPAEFRISLPDGVLDLGVVGTEPTGVIAASEGGPGATEPTTSNHLLAEVATCLWYLKTKFFKREWTDEDTSDPDPRIRRALGRLNKVTDALKEAGLDLQDPINKRYPAGGENLMKPIQFEPTDGLTFEKVIETIAPIIYRNSRLVQRGEVFVAVPREEPTHAPVAIPDLAGPGPTPIPASGESTAVLMNAAPEDVGAASATGAMPALAAEDGTTNPTQAEERPASALGDDLVQPEGSTR